MLLLSYSPFVLDPTDVGNTLVGCQPARVVKNHSESTVLQTSEYKDENNKWQGQGSQYQNTASRNQKKHLNK